MCNGLDPAPLGFVKNPNSSRKQKIKVLKYTLPPKTKSPKRNLPNSTQNIPMLTKHSTNMDSLRNKHSILEIHVVWRHPHNALLRTAIRIPAATSLIPRFRTRIRRHGSPVLSDFCTLTIALKARVCTGLFDIIEWNAFTTRSRARIAVRGRLLLGVARGFAAIGSAVGNNAATEKYCKRR